MIAYNKNNGSPRERQKDPLGEGYLMPGNCTDIKPPEFDSKTHTCKFDGTKWVVSIIPEPEPKPEPELPEQTYADKRRMEYGLINDQLDYIFHHGLEKWKTDIVQPVKDKYPKPS
jgi:hypothetical protein